MRPKSSEGGRGSPRPAPHSRAGAHAPRAYHVRQATLRIAGVTLLGTPTGRGCVAVLNRGVERGQGSGTNKFVYQKWPDRTALWQIFFPQRGGDGGEGWGEWGGGMGEEWGNRGRSTRDVGCGGLYRDAVEENGTEMGPKWDEAPIFHSAISPIFPEVEGLPRSSLCKHQPTALTDAHRHGGECGCLCPSPPPSQRAVPWGAAWRIGRHWFPVTPPPVLPPTGGPRGPTGVLSAGPRDEVWALPLPVVLTVCGCVRSRTGLEIKKTDVPRTRATAVGG